MFESLSQDLICFQAQLYEAKSEMLTAIKQKDALCDKVREVSKSAVGKQEN